MKRYAIYELKTGHILKTHSEVDLGGRFIELSDEEVLSTLDPQMPRDGLGVAAIELDNLSGAKGASHKIDHQTRKLTKG
jgi:hypothetical protein